MKNWLIEKLGGFATVEDAINSSSKREWYLTQAVAKHFNTITKEDLFRKNSKGQYTFKGKPLMQAQVEALKSQAEGFLESKLYEMLDAEVHYQATLKTFYGAATPEDIKEGKLIEWTWDIISTKLRHF